MFVALALILSSALGCASAGAELAAPAPQEKPQARAFDHTHADWSAVLGAHARGERFDYAALKRDTTRLERYLAGLQAVTPEDFAGWTREQRFAFWINAYNAYTVRRVVEGYPLKSIKDLGSLSQTVWDQRFVPLAHLVPALERKLLSLNDIEHEILRPTFADPRLHAAVHCAAVSCPRLLDHAYTAGVLDQQLEQMTTRWLRDPTRNRFDPEQRTAHLSRLFDWYGHDFGKTPAERLAWIARYAPGEHRPWLTGRDAERVVIRYLEYDWALNDVPPEPRQR